MHIIAYTKTQDVYVWTAQFAVIMLTKIIKGKILCVEQETLNMEDYLAECFMVAIVKDETIIGHVIYEFSLHFDCFSSNFQLCFSCVTLPPTPHIWACAPINHD